MRVIDNKPIHDNMYLSTVESDEDENLLGYVTDGFYEINGQIFSGHDIGVMRRVSWDSRAQEWKVPKP